MTGRKIVHRPDAGKTDAFRKAVQEMRDAVKPPSAPNIGDVMPDGTIFGGISPDTGQKMFVAPHDHLCAAFNVAARKVEQLNAEPYLGHNDWRIPSKAELQVLFDNRHTGALNGTFDESGAFTTGWYFSSDTASGPNAIWQQRFDNGVQNFFHYTAQASLRCVR